MNLTTLITFLTQTGTEHKLFTCRDFIDDKALSLGAKLCVSVRDSVDFYFNRKGKLLGTSTTDRNSFKEASSR